MLPAKHTCCMHFATVHGPPTAQRGQVLQGSTFVPCLPPHPRLGAPRCCKLCGAGVSASNCCAAGAYVSWQCGGGVCRNVPCAAVLRTCQGLGVSASGRRGWNAATRTVQQSCACATVLESLCLVVGSVCSAVCPVQHPSAGAVVLPCPVVWL